MEKHVRAIFLRQRFSTGKFSPNGLLFRLDPPDGKLFGTSLIEKTLLRLCKKARLGRQSQKKAFSTGNSNCVRTGRTVKLF